MVSTENDYAFLFAAVFFLRDAKKKLLELILLVLGTPFSLDAPLVSFYYTSCVCESVRANDN